MRLGLLIGAIAFSAHGVGAQTVRVTGIAYDSLGQRPLPSAIISLGTTRTAFADSSGRFAFDSIAPGTYQLTMEHPSVDSLGLSGITVNITARAGMDPVRVAIPSFATMWSRVCGSQAPSNAGLVFGVVRDAATREAMAGADVSARWFDTVATAGAFKSWRIAGRSEATGAYALCGVPVSVISRITALTADRVAAMDLTLAPSARVVRRDLFAWGNTPTIRRGTVTGVVRSNGKPVNDARVLADWTDEVTTGADGRFKLVGVPIGTRQIFVVPLGQPSSSVSVNVTAGDTARIEIPVGADTRVLPEAVVRSRISSDFESRRRSGVGYFRDSVQLAGYSNFFSAFADLDKAIIQSRPNGIMIDLPDCTETPVWIDGSKAGADALLTVKPSDLSGVEIYQRYETPAELRANGINISPRKCAVLLWTRRK